MFNFRGIDSYIHKIISQDSFYILLCSKRDMLKVNQCRM